MIEVVLVFLGVLGTLNTIVWIIAYKWSLDSLRSLRKPEHKPLPSKPFTTIIVPARNEAENLPSLLNSLLSQDYENYEAIIVDDNSVDDTYKVISRYAGRDPRIIPVKIRSEPPPGWSPKVHAIVRGLEHANPETSIYVFLDADTRLLADNVLRIFVSNAYYSKGIVSLNPRFACPTRRCRIAETILTTFAHSFLGFNRVLNPRYKLAWFYGCCWAIRRDVYEKLGGHHAVKHSIVEDRDLAEKAKPLGIPLLVLRAWDLIETKWYPDIKDSVKVLARLMKRHAKKKTKTIIEAFLITLSYLLPILNLALGALLSQPLLALIGVANYVALTIAHVIGVKINKYNPVYALLAPFTGAIMAWGLLEAVKTSRVEWRRREIQVLQG